MTQQANTHNIHNKEIHITFQSCGINLLNLNHVRPRIPAALSSPLTSRTCNNVLAGAINKAIKCYQDNTEITVEFEHITKYLTVTSIFVRFTL